MEKKYTIYDLDPGPGFDAIALSTEEMCQGFLRGSKVAAAYLHCNFEPYAERFFISVNRYISLRSWDRSPYNLTMAQSQMKKLREKMIGFYKTVQDFSGFRTMMIVAQEMNKSTNAEGDAYEQLLVSTELFIDVCNNIIDLPAKKDERRALRRLCAELICLFEEATGRPIIRNWKPYCDGSNAPEKFVKSDAQFILKVAQAIDPELKFEQVRSVLTRSRRPTRPSQFGELPKIRHQKSATQIWQRYLLEHAECLKRDANS